MPDDEARPGSTVISGLLVDTSVFARLARDELIRRQLSVLTRTFTARRILLCPPVAAEVGFMARNGKDHALVADLLGHFAECATAPTTEQTLSIQHALWQGGLVRAACVMDTVIAAYAIANKLAVLHYDSDFEHIATAVPHFQHSWIVPRGAAAV